MYMYVHVDGCTGHTCKSYTCIILCFQKLHPGSSLVCSTVVGNLSFIVKRTCAQNNEIVSLYVLFVYGMMLST